MSNIEINILAEITVFLCMYATSRNIRETARDIQLFQRTFGERNNLPQTQN